MSLEGYTPAKMAAEPQRHSHAPTRHSFPPTRHSFPRDPSLLRADSLLTARGTACLPPEGRYVYRPWDGKFTARGAVSNEF